MVYIKNETCQKNPFCSENIRAVTTIKSVEKAWANYCGIYMCVSSDVRPRLIGPGTLSPFWNGNDGFWPLLTSWIYKSYGK